MIISLIVENVWGPVGTNLRSEYMDSYFFSGEPEFYLGPGLYVYVPITGNFRSVDLIMTYRNENSRVVEIVGVYIAC